MIRSSLRVLLLEESAADAESIQQELDRQGIQNTMERVESKDAFTQALREFAPHVILSDLLAAQFSTLSALELAQQLQPAVPFIVVSGRIDTPAIVASMRAGVEDVLHKANIGQLVPAIEAALNTRQPLQKLSPRQLEVLRLVAQGHTTPAIAGQLGLSAKTVESHRGEIMKRLGIHDLVRLVRYAVRVGLVRLDS